LWRRRWGRGGQSPADEMKKLILTVFNAILLEMNRKDWWRQGPKATWPIG
jgi:hypothetical protein